MITHRTVILDDDPTGTQEATGVPVMLWRDRALLIDLLRGEPTVFILTNSRALPEAEAVLLLEDIRSDIKAACVELGARIDVVLRGDSTLRGHIIAESDVFGARGGVLLVCAAYPAGGRVTCDGVHFVRVDGNLRNAADTEFAKDPVFAYTARSIPELIEERDPGRVVVVSDTARLEGTLRGGAVGPGSVVVVDAEFDYELEQVARVVETLWREGRTIVVRSAAPLAAMIAHAKSTGFLEPIEAAKPILIVAGSHTGATTRQLARLQSVVPERVVISTVLAMLDPQQAGREAARLTIDQLELAGVAVLTSERLRLPEHDTLQHGEKVMEAITTAVSELSAITGSVIAKGGITSAEVARRGMGASVARVIGQLAVGISLWELEIGDRRMPYVVVPGNIGEDGALVDAVGFLSGHPASDGA